MWTLLEARTRLSNRLAETGNTFWTANERRDALNDAQRFLAAVTKGCPETLLGDVDVTQPYLEVQGKLVGDYATGGWVAGEGLRSLRAVTDVVADTIDPLWGQRKGTPRWLVISPHENRVYVTPAPKTPTPASLTVAVIPPDLVEDGEEVFGGEPVMEKYQGPLINIAAALLLLKERYDGDAERFWGFAIQELQALGVDPATLPPLPTPPNQQVEQ